MIFNMRKIASLLITTTLCVVLVVPTNLFASEGITVRPFLFDETLTARDQVTRTVVLRSDYDYRKSTIYATVNEITVDAVGEIREFVSPVMTDRTNTVTSWIEVTRGRIEVMPKETVEIPVTVRTHPNAEPGEYHLFIGFVEAPNRPQAEAIALAGKASGVIMKVTIADKRQDSLRISRFLIDRFITTDDKRSISIEVENVGDLPSAPSGEIIFYDARGIEVTSVPVNTTAQSVAPGESITLTSEVPIGNDLGKYKANVLLRYGERQQASLHDTAFFYMMPLHLLLLLFGAILLVAIVIALLFRRAFRETEDDDDCQEVTMYVRDGHDPNPQDHDIDLKNN
jgi:hypothetical protein